MKKTCEKTISDSDIHASLDQYGQDIKVLITKD